MKRVRRLVGLTPEMLDAVLRLQKSHAIGGAAPSVEGILSEAVKIGLAALEAQDHANHR